LSALHGQQELAVQQEAEARAAAAQAAAAQAAWQQQHDAKKAQVQHYKQQLAEQLAHAREAEEQAAVEAAAVLQAAIAAQKPIVEARQAECLEKRQEQMQQHHQRQAQREERRAQLDAIAAVLAPNIASDPARVLQPTAASAAAADAAAGGAAFKPVHGYTTAQVVADPRFRVVEALNSAGLLSGAAKGYVQQVVAAVQPATASRIDNYTSSQLQAAARRLG
jgi:chromosome segregation ATPase